MIPRSEHPNPQFMRNNWQNLNGEWEFESDRARSGLDREFYKREHLSGKITVPFCPESTLSGIGDVDFHNCVWYRRDVTISKEKLGGRVILHFGAVDHTAYVYVNSEKVGVHVGGYSSFSFDITHYIPEDGRISICVCAVDEDRNPVYGHGKQSREYASHRCYYTRVTGIWQTVWLEYLPEKYIKSVRYYPDAKNGAFSFEAELCGKGELSVESFYGGKATGSVCVESDGTFVRGFVKLSEKHLWEVGHGRLYDVVLKFGDDVVNSYFGLRDLSLDGYKFLLNGRSVFQRLVLDQGYYPDGIYTAPDDEALERDIRISQEAGFNGARLHQKVFEPRFLYHCDKAGYMVWGEYGNWGIDYSDINALPPFLQEWCEVIKRDFNHPSLVGWCPLNETWAIYCRRQNDEFHRSLYRVTKLLDTTRPCIDTSGLYHVETDIFDLHDYHQDVEEFAKIYSNGSPEADLEEFKHHHVQTLLYQGPYVSGTPFFVSEYGGIKWDVDSKNSAAWGYGNAPTTEKEFKERYEGLTNVLLDSPYMMGFCYTQLYDVEQEVNGLYTYDRKPKFDMSIFKKINERKAAIED